MEGRIRDEIPGGGWYLGSMALGICVGAIAILAVADLYPDDSDGPLLIGVVVGVMIFAVLGVVGVIGARILAALSELDGNKTPDARSPSPN